MAWECESVEKHLPQVKRLNESEQTPAFDTKNCYKDRCLLLFQQSPFTLAKLHSFRFASSELSFSQA